MNLKEAAYKVTPVEGVTRIEVIDETGRVWSRWYTGISFSLQDDGATLKIFVEPGRRPDKEGKFNSAMRGLKL